MTAPPLAHEGCEHRRWVIAELDVRGEIEDHAAMCLQYAIEGALASAAATIVVDLRDLTAIDDAGRGMLTQAEADCRACGVRLRLLICGEAITDGFGAERVADRLQVMREPCASPPVAPRARTRSARAPRRKRVRSAALPFSAVWLRRSASA